MQEQVATTPTEVAPEQSLDEKIAAKFGMNETESSEPDEQEAPPAEQSEESEGDEPEVPVEEEVAPEVQAPAELELKHKGQIRKVSQEEAINLAQKGFDYEQNMAALKADRQQLAQAAQALEAQRQFASQSIEHIAEAKAFERALGEFANVDWIKESTDDPIGAFQKRQKYDSLVAGYNAAVARAQQAQQQYSQARGVVDQQVIAAEQKAIVEAVPQWKDQKVYEREWPEINKLAAGVLKPETMAALEAVILQDHGVSVLLRDAWKYRQAVAQAKAKGKQVLPGVPKPGAPAPRLTKAEAVKEGLKQVHQAKDPKRREALLDEVIAKKFGLA